MLEKSKYSDYSRNFSQHHWTEKELHDLWTLSLEERKLTQRKNDNSQLVYALKMRYFDIYGCFPIGKQDIPEVVTAMVAAQFSTNPEKLEAYPWHSRSAQIHNNEIRTYYGFRTTSDADWQKVHAFIENSLWVQGLPIALIYNDVYRFFKNEKLEPPAHQEFARKINTICTQLENKLFQECIEHINTKIAAQLQNLIEIQENTEAPLSFIRTPAGKTAHPTITEELQKLEYLRPVLSLNFFSTIPRRILKKYHDLVMISSPYDLRAMTPLKSQAILACFCAYKGAQILDHLAEVFIKRFRKIQKIAEEKAKEDLWKWYQTTDKNKLLDDMVDISLKYPDGIIKEKIYTGVGGEEKLRQSQIKRKSSKQICQEFEYKHLRSLYIHHHRHDFLAILKVMQFKSASLSELCLAIDAILNNTELSLKGIVSKKIQKIVDSDRMYAEIAVLRVLQKELKCKNVWIKSTFKYTDPEKDLPQDFWEKKQAYCQMLNLPEDGKIKIPQLKAEMVEAIKAFNDTIKMNPDVKIKKRTHKSGQTTARLCLTPYQAQQESPNIQALKNEIERLWPNNSLLDMLKEADLRVSLTQDLTKMTNKVTLDHKILQERLLLCLFAMGTNTELKKVCAGSTHTESDLWYVKKRFITPEGLRHILIKLTNSTLAIREEKIWGHEIDLFASDSTKFAVWPGNTMSEYHIRYQGNGVMAYWHTDKKALCISGQLRKCADSEVAAMLTGILHHGTKAKVKYHATDTHGQSFVAFAFAYLLGIELRPRIKSIGKLKLSMPDQHFPKSYYNNLEPVMGKAINWQPIEENYDNILRYLVALKLRTAEVDVLLKRFISENKKDPVCKAILEFGRAVFTVFSCNYLRIKEIRIEVEEALNVIENWNSGNNFIFFGRRGVISSNDPVEQEMSILALQLLQSSLVYINTLMIQQVLKRKNWTIQLTTEDKRALTALFFLHLNQYGIYILNMDERLNIDDV